MPDAANSPTTSDDASLHLPMSHEAERVSGPSGAVQYGVELTLAQAVSRRKAGLDIVVVGADKLANRKLAQEVEAAVGRYVFHLPHDRPEALPHFQQRTPPPEGHTFYEVDHRKARKK